MAINHIGIIMDGNRRFSRRIMLEPWKGHEFGAKKVREVLGWCKEYKISMLTLYTFSYENFNRPKQEFDFLMKLFEAEFRALLDDNKEIMKDEVKIQFVGRIEMFPKQVTELMQKIMKMTESNKRFIVNFAMAYSGRLELVDAVRKIIEAGVAPSKVDEGMLLDNLYIHAEPELIIRTGGEKRLSNFLTFQSVYSELFFVDTFWPEFKREEFDTIIGEFESRHRRFGK